MLDNLPAAAFASNVHAHAAADIATGTLADERLSANVPLLDANQLFSGSNQFSGVLVADQRRQQPQRRVLRLGRGPDQPERRFAGQPACGGFCLQCSRACRGGHCHRHPGRRAALGNVALLDANQVSPAPTSSAAYWWRPTAANNLSGAFFRLGAGLTDIGGGAITAGAISNLALAAEGRDGRQGGRGPGGQEPQRAPDDVTLAAGTNVTLTTTARASPFPPPAGDAWSLTATPAPHPARTSSALRTTSRLNCASTNTPRTAD